MVNYRQLEVKRIAEAAAARSSDSTRHKCFISYNAADMAEVESFLDEFGEAFIPRVIGVTDDDPWVESDNTDYIMDKIREEHLTDSTVTIVLLGRCTWSRKYVDWEIYSSLRNDKNNKRSGLMGISLPSFVGDSRQIPNRLADNVDGQDGYARWWKYPSSMWGLRSLIDEAFEARVTKAHLIDNSRTRKINNSPCF